MAHQKLYKQIMHPKQPDNMYKQAILKLEPKFPVLLN